MIKIGDKFVCIKKRYGYPEPYIINNIYTINYVSYIKVSFSTNYSKSNDGYVFYLHKDGDYYYLYDYMIPLNQHRKQKLLNLRSL